MSALGPYSVAGKKRGAKSDIGVDLMMCDSELTNVKVSLKLHELEYKLEVEKSVEKGVKNMMSALSRSPSQNRKQDAELKGSLSWRKKRSTCSTVLSANTKSFTWMKGRRMTKRCMVTYNERQIKKSPIETTCVD